MHRRTVCSSSKSPRNGLIRDGPQVLHGQAVEIQHLVQLPKAYTSLHLPRITDEKRWGRG